jgi:DNA polymerase III subunit delta
VSQQNLYLFYGDDSYSLLQRVRMWRNEFGRKHGDTNLETLDGKGLESNYLKQAFETLPFLGEKRLLIVNNFLDKGNANEQKKIAPALEHIPETCVVVFAENGTPDKRTTLYKKLKKESQLIEFPILEGFELNKWIIKEIENEGGSIDQNTASYLGSLAEGNLWMLINEIKKLCAYCEKRPVTMIEVELLVNANLHNTIFQFTDALGQKNAKTSLELLHNLIESGEDLIRIFFMMIRQFRLIIQIKDLKERGLRENEITSKLKQHPFVIRNTIKQCSNFETETLREIYAALLEIDTKFKTGKIKHLVSDQRDLTLALDRFIIGICC